MNIQPPYPGSDEAIERGCTCPVIDNGHGKMERYVDGERVWWIDSECPLHGMREESTR